MKNKVKLINLTLMPQTDGKYLSGEILFLLSNLLRVNSFLEMEVPGERLHFTASVNILGNSFPWQCIKIIPPRMGLTSLYPCQY